MWEEGETWPCLATSGVWWETSRDGESGLGGPLHRNDAGYIGPPAGKDRRGPWLNEAPRPHRLNREGCETGVSATINRWTRRVDAIGESNKLNIHCPNTSKQRQPHAEQNLTAWVMASGQCTWGIASRPSAHLTTSRLAIMAFRECMDSDWPSPPGPIDTCPWP